jgi:hypothetical protein
MRLILTLAVMLTVACAPEAPAPAEPVAEVSAAPATPASAPGELVMFMAPSGNIGCTYVPAGGTDVYQPSEPGAELQCDRMEPTFTRILLPENGAARAVETEERGCCTGLVIAYGQRWVEGPFACDVSEAGVACTSSAGHGFTLSRARADVH